MILLKKSNNATGVDIFNLTEKNDLVVLKAEVRKPYINKLGNVHTSSNNSKTKVDDLNVKLKTVPVDLKKLSDVLSKGVLKKIQQTK